mmetsp:Transcript_27153/g.52646  ORF Transcript_27153/g.52646 Transcript_27153/m.52646 type:complete len:170 (+) Transcript_27153:1-510(+)
MESKDASRGKREDTSSMMEVESSSGTSSKKRPPARCEYIFRAERYFCLLEITFPDARVELTKVTVVGMLQAAVDDLFGKVGLGLYTAEVLTVFGNNAIISMSESVLTPVWSSLTLLSSFRNERCRVLVKKASPFLVSIADVVHKARIEEQESNSKPKPSKRKKKKATRR